MARQIASAQTYEWGSLSGQRCSPVTVTLCHSPNWCQLVTFHRRQRSYPSFHHWEQAFCSTWFSLKSSTDNTSILLTVPWREKVTSLTVSSSNSLTAGSKAVMFLAFVALTATRTQRLRLCWTATNLGLGDWCPWRSSAEMEGFL